MIIIRPIWQIEGESDRHSCVYRKSRSINLAFTQLMCAKGQTRLNFHFKPLAPHKIWK
jgi:hypothetical protein